MIRLVAAIVVISCFPTFFACDRNDDHHDVIKPEIENTRLKTKLLGHWERIDLSSVHYLRSQLQFTADSLIWRDSTATLTSPGNGEMQTLISRCPAEYRHRDQVNCCVWYELPDYLFHNAPSDNILWVCVMKGGKTVITDYKLVNGVYSSQKRIHPQPVATYLTSSYVEFSNNDQTATFFEPIDWWNYSSIQFNKTTGD